MDLSEPRHAIIIEYDRTPQDDHLQLQSQAAEYLRK
jgi:hypothetical protein